MNLNLRDKSIIIGLYLSKFDKEALKILGFNGFMEAYNTLGYAIGAKPLSLRNYRDEFDPYFSNSRKGWYNRNLRKHCEEKMQEFSALNFNEYTDLVKELIIENYAIEKVVSSGISGSNSGESVAKRLMTGKSAESYFMSNYNSIALFEGYNLTDTTNFGCGFDFKLSLGTKFFCVEVKGLNAGYGSISFTEKEFFVAKEMKEKYCLFIVSNFARKPIHQYFIDPLNSGIEYKKVEKQVIVVNYTASIKKNMLQ
jgi:hypothetical protein